MNLTIIHGGDVVASMKKLDALVAKFPEMGVVRSDGEVSEEFLINNLQGLNMFEDKKLVVLTNPQADLNLEKYAKVDVEVVMFFDKALTSSSLFLKIKNAQEFIFEKKPDKTIFTFLDLLGDKNPKAFSLFDKLFDEFGDQYLLTMLFYLFRRQILTNTRMPDSIKQKMEKQRQNFPKERLKTLYRTTLETDYKIKTGMIEPKIGLFLLVEQIIN